MANEAQVSVNFTVNKNGVVSSLSQAVALTLSGDKIFSNIQLITNTDPEGMLLGEITNPQMLILQNIDTTNFITVQLSGTDILTLPVGGPPQVLSPKTGTTYSAQADTAPAKLSVIAIGT